MKLNELLLFEYKTTAEQELAHWYHDCNNTQQSCFISYTNLEKIGINPQTTWNTPIGIYCYPLKEAFTEYNLGTNSTSVPFGGQRPHIWVLRSESNLNMLDFSEYTESDLNTDLKKLKNYIEKVDSTNDLEYYSTDNRDFMRVNDDIEKFFDETKSKSYVKTPAGYIWNITRVISTSIATHFRPRRKRTVIWTSILNKVLGYSGFIDKGHGIVDEYEPIQAAFFRKEYFKAVDKINNTTSRKEAIKTIKSIAKTLKGFSIEKTTLSTVYDQLEFLESFVHNGFVSESQFRAVLDYIKTKIMSSNQFLIFEVDDLAIVNHFKSEQEKLELLVKIATSDIGIGGSETINKKIQNLKFYREGVISSMAIDISPQTKEKFSKIIDKKIKSLE